ncbi:MAG: hypothetical protein J5I81_12630 [Nitrococcus mobilis]|nr:hypothetical protein [Nitrococcus mobilis]
MGMSVANRQRRYRKRHLKHGTDERLSMVTPTMPSASSSGWRGIYYNVSQKTTLEWLLAAAERRVVAGIEDTAAYYEGCYLVTIAEG